MLAALILGVLQGLTEFLPVSSSGHLVLFQEFLPAPGDEVLFDLVVHLGTLVPVLYFYRANILDMLRAPFSETGALSERPNTRLILLVVLATIPTGLIGVGLKDPLEALFDRPSVLSLTFAITGALLFATRYARTRDTDQSSMLWWHALVIGLAQGIAIAPGISRSGTTIAVALFLGMNREYAARFSFLLAIPAILGAFVLKARDAAWDQVEVLPLLVGAVAALLSGYVALVLLVKLVKEGGFDKFAFYVWALAALCLVGTLLGWFA
ncbi:MAG TPA: undecaprenyl-diphosphate phosphatase [Myxococcota bacterium]|nr:undecaprenyl-diphosphate phosphatase [Myxococcota bacterium]